METNKRVALTKWEGVAVSIHVLYSHKETRKDEEEILLRVVEIIMQTYMKLLKFLNLIFLEFDNTKSLHSNFAC